MSLTSPFGLAWFCEIAVLTFLRFSSDNLHLAQRQSSGIYQASALLFGNFMPRRQRLIMGAFGIILQRLVITMKKLRELFGQNS